MKTEKTYEILLGLEKKDKSISLDQNTIWFLESRGLANIVDDYSYSIKKDRLTRVKKIDSIMDAYCSEIDDYKDKIHETKQKMGSFFYKCFHFESAKHDEQLKLEDLRNKLENTKKNLKKFQDEKNQIMDVAEEITNYIHINGVYVGLSEKGKNRVKQIKPRLPEIKDIDYDVFEKEITTKEGAKGKDNAKKTLL